MERLIGICLARPVSVTAVALLVVALAAAALVRLPVTLLPDLRYPALTVWTPYENVPPDRVERAVTLPVERAVAGTAGVRRTTARSFLGGSIVHLELGWGTDLDLALLDVREQLDRVSGTLPPEAGRPAVLRLDPSRRPILVVALAGAAAPPGGALAVGGAPAAGGAGPDRLHVLAREIVARRLEQVDGVARALVAGDERPVVEVTPDLERFAALGLRLEQLEAALVASNVSLSGGTIREGPYRFAVEVEGEFRSVEDVGRAVLARPGGGLVRVGDVAAVRLRTAERRGLVRLDGAPSVLLLVERRPDANTVRVASAVHDVLAELRTELPEAELAVLVDESRAVRAALRYVIGAVLLGALLAVGALLLFVRRARVLAAVALAVPLSLAAALVLFDAFGLTLNLISLGGLALGVGLLVDNAVVVAENVARLRERGTAPLEAARRGAAGVAGAITASTLTTTAVFLPITFVEGLSGRLFGEQALAVVCSLAASLVVALTVVPLVLSRERAGPPGAPSGLSEPAAARGLFRAYERGLTWSLRHRAVVLGGAALALAAFAVLAPALPREAVPTDPGDRLAARLTLPPDASLELVSDRAADFETRARALPGVRHVIAEVGEPERERLELDPRPLHVADVTLLLAPGAAPGVSAALSALPVPPDTRIELRPVRSELELLLGASDADLALDLSADARSGLDALLATLAGRLADAPALTNLRPAVGQDVPVYHLLPDYDRLALRGITPATLERYVEAATGNRAATALRGTSEDVPLVIRTGRLSRERLLATRLPSPGGGVPLHDVARLETSSQAAALLRTDQRPVARLLADIAPGSDLGAAERAARSAAADLPAGVRLHVGGSGDAFRESLRAVGLSLLFSVLLVYLILAAQFESFRQPFIVLAAVPLAGLGVVLALALTGHTVNLMSMTGAVILVGLVVNDAILKVDFINQRRREGAPLTAAIHEAGRDRLRPILITTITTALGMLPLALGLGEGAATRAPLAVAVVGGLLAASVLTLFVVPVLYAVAYRQEGTGP